MEVIGQRDGRGEEGFKRRLFDVLGGRALVTGIEIVVEIRAEIDFVKRIGGGRRLGRFGSGGAGRYFARLSWLCFCQFRSRENGCRILPFRSGLRAIGYIDFHRARGHFENRLVRRIPHPLSFE